MQAACCKQRPTPFKGRVAAADEAFVHQEMHTGCNRCHYLCDLVACKMTFTVQDSLIIKAIVTLRTTSSTAILLYCNLQPLGVRSSSTLHAAHQKDLSISACTHSTMSAVFHTVLTTLALDLTTHLLRSRPAAYRVPHRTPRLLTT